MCGFGWVVGLDDFWLWFVWWYVMFVVLLGLVGCVFVVRWVGDVLVFVLGVVFFCIVLVVFSYCWCLLCNFC